MTDKPDPARLVFRIPADLKDEVDEFTTETCRSLNQSLIYLVKRGLKAEAASAPTA